MHDLTKKTYMRIGISFILIGIAFLLYDGLLLFYKLIIFLDYVGFVLISFGTLLVCFYIATEHNKFETIDIYAIFFAIILFLCILPPSFPIPNIIEGTVALVISPLLIAIAVFHVSTLDNPNTRFVFPLALWASQLLFYTIWEGINYVLDYIVIISNSSSLFLLNIMAPVIFTSFFEIYALKRKEVTINE